MGISGPMADIISVDQNPLGIRYTRAVFVRTLLVIIQRPTSASYAAGRLLIPSYFSIHLTHHDYLRLLMRLLMIMPLSRLYYY